MTAALARVVVDMCIFFDSADDETVDPDAAVRQLEILADGLKGLSVEDQGLLSEAIRGLATEEAHYASSIRRIPEDLGLEESL